METMKTLKIIHAEKNVPGMTKEEIDKFLSTGRKILRFGTVDVDGGPAIHPVWYYYNNDKVYLFTGKNARKLQNVKKSAQVYFSIDTDAAPNKGVRGKGTARILTDPSKTVPLGEKIVGRYMDNIESGLGEGYGGLGQGRHVDNYRDYAQILYCLGLYQADAVEPSARR